MRAKRSIISVLAVATASAAGAIAIVDAQGDAATGPPAWAPAAQANNQARLPTVQAAQSAAFGVLRRSQVGAEGVTGTPTGPFGANRALERTVTAGSVGPVSVVPANNAVCLRATEDPTGPGWACGPTDGVAKNGLMLTIHKSDAAQVVGIGMVPDGVATVTLTSDIGATTLPVKDNVYGFQASHPTMVTFDSGGQTLVSNVP
jgi:hypothetical protein